MNSKITTSSKKKTNSGVQMALQFQNTTLPLAERVPALMEQLTTEEKIGLINYRNAGIPRLGIPPYVWWNEALHGLARSGCATVFPQAIAMAATFSTELIREMGNVIALEGRARHAQAKRHGDFGAYKGLTYWAPNINIFRDPRWGRGHETYGECPFLTGELGAAYVQGVQGTDPDHLTAVATPKHFAVHSGPEKTRLEFNAEVDQRDLRETYLPAFKRCVEAGAQSIMSAYNALNGVPCSANACLLNDILRGEWHFEGAVVTDAGAGSFLYQFHHCAPDYAAAVAQELKNGVDVATDEEHGVREALAQGLISEADLDRAVRNQLRVKFRLGFFDDAEFDPGIDVIECPRHRQVALDAARRSIVLLKNQDGILPLSKATLKTIVVIGPNADDKNVLLGNYFGTPTRTTTILQGILAEAGDTCVVRYAKGCESYKLRTEGCAEDYDRIAEAVDIAASADVVILCLGLNPQLEGEAGDAFNSEAAGDKTTLAYPGLQNYLLQAVAEVNPKVILLNVSGSAVTFDHSRCKGIVQVFYPGAEGGRAVADILFGRICPSGRLPVTFYEGLEQLPAFDDYSMEQRTYRFFSGKVLYPFGFGMSYTRFSYRDLQFTPIGSGEGCHAQVRVTNEGDLDAEEVVLLFARALNASTRVPLKQLVAFQRISLAAHETQVVCFEIPPERFLITYADGRQGYEDCDWEIFKE